MKRLLLLLLFPTIAMAQGGHFSTTVVTTSGQAVSFPTVRVCLGTQTAVPCTSVGTNVYANLTLTAQKANPFTGDGAGNVDFYALPGDYSIQISGTGINTYTLVDSIVPPNLLDTNILTFSNSALLPAVASTQNLGSSSFPWNIFANDITIVGTVSGTIKGSIADCGGQVFNVVCNGADPTGVASSNTAVIAAASAAGLAGPCFPPGVYNLSTTITPTAFANISGCGQSGGNNAGLSGTCPVMINWTGAGNGPVFSEVNTSGLNAGDLFNRNPSIGGFCIENTGGATALIPISLTNILGPDFHDLTIVNGTSGGYCITLNSTNSLFIERWTLESTVTLHCGDSAVAGSGDIGFLTSGGTGSFENGQINGAKLDGHQFDIGVGSNIYGSSLTYHGNSGPAALITVEGGGHDNTIFGRTDCVSSACVPYNIAAGKMFDYSGQIQVTGNSVANPVVGAGASWLPWLAGSSGDSGGLLLSTLPNYPSATYTQYVATAARADNNDSGAGIDSALGVFSDALGTLSGDFMLFPSNVHSNEEGRTIVSGSGPTLDVGMFADGTIRTGQQVVNFASLSGAPWSTSPNGSIIYCSDCNSTCAAGSSTGRTCFRENGAWVH